MKFFSKLVLVIVVLIAILVGILAIFVVTFDANDYKQEITRLVQKQTGRELLISGDLKLAVYPDIALQMGKTSLTNSAGFAGEKFASFDSGKVSVKLIPLLKKQIQADGVQLDGLKLNLHRKADGSANWDDLVKSDPAKQESTEEKAPAKVVEEMMKNLSIAGVNLKNAHINWRDDQAKQEVILSPLNLKTGKFSLGKPLPLELDLVMKQKNPAITVAVEGNTTVSLSKDKQSFALSKLKLHTKISGTQIPNGNLEANFSGNIKGNQQKISIPDLSIESTLTGDLIPQGTVKTSIKGNAFFDVNAQQLSITGLKLESNIKGKPLAGGTLQALVSGDAKLNMATQKLTIPNLALDAKLAGGHFKGGTANAIIKGNTQFDLVKQLLFINGMTIAANASGNLLKGGKANTNLAGDIQLNMARSQIKSSQLTVNSQVEGGLIPGGKLTQSAKGNIDMNWANQQGVVTLSNLLVKLAGLEIKGSQVRLQPLIAKPSISGQFQTNVFNLKQILKTLGITPPVTNNPTALSQVQASFSLKADTDKVDLQGLKVKLDKSTLTGKLGITNFASPSLRPQLTINSINLDDYLAPPAKTETASQVKYSVQQELLPVEMLHKVNVDGNFKIGKMIVNKLTLSNITAKIKAREGLVIIDPANASLYKGKYNGRITLDTKQVIPSIKMRHELVGIRSEGLLFDLFQDRYISGGTKLITEFSSRGNTINALLKNLNGKTNIAFNDGTIRDSNLAEKVSLAVKIFEKKELKDGKSVVKFTGLSGDWKTTNGVFTTNNLSLLSPYFKITGSGTANVVNQKLDMKLRIGSNKKTEDRYLFAPLHIYGTFSNPKFKLDLQDLLKVVAQQDLDRVKKEAKEKLKLAEDEARKKLKLKEEAIKQDLQKKVEKAKADALKKLQDKVGSELTDKLKNKLDDKADTGGEAKSNVKDQLKNKLKDKLKGFF